MEQTEFAAFFERYREQCIGAGVEPLTPEAMQDRIARWEFLGLSWGGGRYGIGSDGSTPQHPKH